MGDSRRAKQAGINSLQLVLLLVLAGGIYAAVTFGPPYIRDYQLENAFDDEARRAHLVAADEIRQNVLHKAREIGFEDWEASDIVVKRDEQTRRITVSAEYDVPVELFWGRVVTLHFAPTVDRAIERR